MYLFGCWVCFLRLQFIIPGKDERKTEPWNLNTLGHPFSTDTENYRESGVFQLCHQFQCPWALDYQDHWNASCLGIPGTALSEPRSQGHPVCFRLCQKHYMKPKGKKKCGSQRDEMAESKDLELTSSRKTPKSQLTAEQSSTKKDWHSASLVVRWLRICPAMQGTLGWFLVKKDTTCHEATKPMCHNYWVHTLEPMSWNHWAHICHNCWSLHA